MSSLKYPLAISDGSVTLTDNYALIVQGAIMSALVTELEERAYRPDYGLPRLEFESVSNLTEIMSICRQTIAEGLVNYPDVSYELRAALTDDGLLDLSILYEIGDETFESNITI